MSAVLVTGGAGFVGCHLVAALLAGGERVRVLDNLDPLAHPDGGAPARLSADAELITGDLRDRASIERALSGVDRVFHLGGVVGNGESMVNVRRAVDVNSGGTATLLEAVVERRDRIRRLVVASSMVVYGEGAYDCSAHGRLVPGPRPTEQLQRREWEPRCPTCGRELAPARSDERTPLRPVSVYGITKRDQEELALTLGAAHGLETTALRYLNVYGPGQALGNPYTGVAAIFAARLISRRRPIVFEDGRQLRDLVHVSDVVRATIAAMDSAEAPGNAINIATGRPVTVAALAHMLAKELDSTLEPALTGEFRAGDVRHCLVATARAHRLLGFAAKVTLDAGLPDLAEWVARQAFEERGDAALADLRSRGLVG